MTEPTDEMVRMGRLIGKTHEDEVEEIMADGFSRDEAERILEDVDVET